MVVFYSEFILNACGYLFRKDVSSGIAVVKPNDSERLSLQEEANAYILRFWLTQSPVG
jgi:hypothetical protein